MSEKRVAHPVKSRGLVCRKDVVKRILITINREPVDICEGVILQYSDIEPIGGKKRMNRVNA